MNATQHLQAAIACLAERGKQYDNPAGERSMEATVDAFEAVTGHSLTVAQGWLFMALLKAVRTQQGEYKADSFIDGAAYFALAGESAAQTAPADLPSHDDWEAGEARMDAIGMNGNDGAHYGEPVQTDSLLCEALASADEKHDWAAMDSDGQLFSYGARPTDSCCEWIMLNGGPLAHMCELPKDARPPEPWDSYLYHRTPSGWVRIPA